MPLPRWARELGLDQEQYETLVDEIWNSVNDNGDVELQIDDGFGNTEFRTINIGIDSDSASDDGYLYYNDGFYYPDPPNYPAPEDDEWEYPEDEPYPEPDEELILPSVEVYSNMRAPITSADHDDVFDGRTLYPNLRRDGSLAFLDVQGNVRFCPRGHCCGHICNGIRDNECKIVPGNYTEEIKHILKRAHDATVGKSPTADLKQPEGRKIIREAATPERKILRKDTDGS